MQLEQYLRNEAETAFIILQLLKNEQFIFKMRTSLK